MLYSNLGNKNSDAGHIKCSRGPHLARVPQVPHPCPKQWLRACLPVRVTSACFATPSPKFFKSAMWPSGKLRLENAPTGGGLLCLLLNRVDALTTRDATELPFCDDFARLIVLWGGYVVAVPCEHHARLPTIYAWVSANRWDLRRWGRAIAIATVPGPIRDCSLNSAFFRLRHDSAFLSISRKSRSRDMIGRIVMVYYACWANKMNYSWNHGWVCLAKICSSKHDKETTPGHQKTKGYRVVSPWLGGKSAEVLPSQLHPSSNCILQMTVDAEIQGFKCSFVCIRGLQSRLYMLLLKQIIWCTVDFAVRDKCYKTHDVARVIRISSITYRTGDVTIKITPSCITFHCANYPKPQSVTGWESSTAVLKKIMNMQELLSLMLEIR